MKYSEILPSPRYTDIVRCYWSLEGDSGPAPAEPERVLPDGNPELVFNLADPYRRSETGGDERQPLTIVVGQMTRSISIRPTGRISLFGVRFRPYGMHPLTEVIPEITDRIGSVSEIFGRPGVEIEEQVKLADGAEHRREIFESWLARQMAGVPRNPIIGRAVGTIEAGGGLVRVGTLARDLGISERSLERGFRDSVGIPPKSYARIVRLQTAVRSLGRSPDLADAAYRAGYFDQAHFTHDFREFAGITPGAFAREANLMAGLFAGPDVGFLQ
jgi:AraC-like DNA-binding protein